MWFSVQRGGRTVAAMLSINVTVVQDLLIIENLMHFNRQRKAEILNYVVD